MSGHSGLSSSDGKTSSSAKRALVLSSFYLPGYKSGGIAVSVSGILKKLKAKTDVSFDLMTKNYDLGDAVPYPDIEPGVWIDRPECRAMYLPRGRLRYRAVAQAVRYGSYDRVFINGMFSLSFSFFPLVLLRLMKHNKRVIVAPHGDLLLSMVRCQSFWKKKLLFVMRYLGLYDGVLWRASTPHEKKAVLLYFPGAKVDVVLDLPKDVSRQEGVRTKQQGVLRMVFLSRIVHSKNLAAVIHYLENIKNKGKVVFDVYGPVEQKEYFESVMGLASKLPDHITVRYQGARTQDEVMSTLAQYDLFVLPSFSENYGYVINEALCVGTPVLISDRTPWKAVMDVGAGFVYDLADEQKFVDRLNDFVAMDETEHARYRQAAMTFAQGHANQDHLLGDYLKLFGLCEV